MLCVLWMWCVCGLQRTRLLCQRAKLVRRLHWGSLQWHFCRMLSVMFRSKLGAPAASSTNATDLENPYREVEQAFNILALEPGCTAEDLAADLLITLEHARTLRLMHQELSDDLLRKGDTADQLAAHARARGLAFDSIGDVYDFAFDDEVLALAVVKCLRVAFNNYRRRMGLPAVAPKAN